MEAAGFKKASDMSNRKSKAPGANSAPGASGLCLSEHKLRLPKNQLVVATSVRSTAAVKTSTAMESATAMKAIAAVKTSTAMESATTMKAIPAAEAVAIFEATTEAASGEAARIAPEAIPRASIKAASVVAAAIKAATVVAMEPGAGTDKHAAYKVVWPVIAIRRAGIRIVAVVTVVAHWSRSKACAVHGTYSNAHGKLCPRVSCGKEQNPQQCSVFEISHVLASYPAWKSYSKPKWAGTLPGNLAWGSDLHTVKPGSGGRVARGFGCRISRDARGHYIGLRATCRRGCGRRGLRLR
jgi:hypothetical protein